MQPQPDPPSQQQHNQQQHSMETLFNQQQQRRPRPNSEYGVHRSSSYIMDNRNAIDSYPPHHRYDQLSQDQRPSPSLPMHSRHSPTFQLQYNQQHQTPHHSIYVEPQYNHQQERQRSASANPIYGGQRPSNNNTLGNRNVTNSYPLPYYQYDEFVLGTFASLSPHSFLQPMSAATAAGNHPYWHSYGQYRTDEPWYNTWLLPSGEDTHPYHMPPYHQLDPPPSVPYTPSSGTSTSTVTPHAANFSTYPSAAFRMYSSHDRIPQRRRSTTYAAPQAYPHAMPVPNTVAPLTANMHSSYDRMPLPVSVEGTMRRRHTTNATLSPRPSDITSRAIAPLVQVTREAPLTLHRNYIPKETKPIKRSLSECTSTDTNQPSKLDQIQSKEDRECCICLDEPSALDLASINSCAHKFCFTCIEKWSENENTCPLCKTRFTKIERVNKPPPHKKRKRGEKRIKQTKKVRNRDQRQDVNIGLSVMRIPSTNPGVDTRSHLFNSLTFQQRSNLPDSILYHLLMRN